MKALSILPDYAMNIVLGQKTVEVRTWRTDYRGPLLICSTAKKIKGTIPGHALGVVDLIDCVPLTKKLAAAAMMPDWQPAYKDMYYAWILDENKIIVPQPVKGKLSLWECDCPIIYPDGVNDGVEDENGDIICDGFNDFYENVWQPLMI